MILKQLDHIAFRVSQLEPVVGFYTGTLGFTVIQEMELDFNGSRAVSRVLNLTGKPFYIFVDQGLDPENIITKWVEKHGSGLHHMAYGVEDIQSTEGL
jgi:methylmalonyl-CoA/ethylmalonyl-CoA epimerase